MASHDFKRCGCGNVHRITEGCDKCASRSRKVMRTASGAPLEPCVAATAWCASHYTVYAVASGCADCIAKALTALKATTGAPDYFKPNLYRVTKWVTFQTQEVQMALRDVHGKAHYITWTPSEVEDLDIRALQANYLYEIDLAKRAVDLRSEAMMPNQLRITGTDPLGGNLWAIRYSRYDTLCWGDSETVSVDASDIRYTLLRAGRCYDFIHPKGDFLQILPETGRDTALFHGTIL